MNATHTIKDVSIIIVTYKGDDLTRNCLDSLTATCGTDPQIIVVDNSPAESTRQIVATCANAIYLPSPGNPGFAGGNNRALPYCTKEYILLLDWNALFMTHYERARIIAARRRINHLRKTSDRRIFKIILRTPLHKRTHAVYSPQFLTNML